MALIVETAFAPGPAEGLAGAASGPCVLAIRPPGLSEGVAPDPDPGEEVALGVSPEVVGPNKSNVSLIYVAWRDVARGDEVPQPLRGVWVDLVVVGGHSPCRLFLISNTSIGLAG
jgi:hypothetical protein